MKVRTRGCKRSSCTGKHLETQTCNQQPCHPGNVPSYYNNNIYNIFYSNVHSLISIIFIEFTSSKPTTFEDTPIPRTGIFGKILQTITSTATSDSSTSTATLTPVPPPSKYRLIKEVSRS